MCSGYGGGNVMITVWSDGLMMRHKKLVVVGSTATVNIFVASLTKHCRIFEPIKYGPCHSHEYCTHLGIMPTVPNACSILGTLSGPAPPRVGMPPRPPARGMPPLPLGTPEVFVAGAGVCGFWNLDDILLLGGLSTKDVSVVRNVASMSSGP